MPTSSSVLPRARGRFVDEDGLEWYRIDDVDRLEPFLVSVISPYDHWIYVSSSGALTAGRGNANRALFPYETDDRLHRGAGRVGPITILRVGDDVIWEPFRPHVPANGVERSLSKTIEGDRLRFEERHSGLGLTFRTTWAASLEHGLVRRCELELDEGAPALTVEVLDGLLDVLPAGVELSMQQATSTLVDAYRRNEFDEASGLAIFSLEAAISDKPLAEEAMTANVIWSRGLDDAVVALSDRQVPCVRAGEPLTAEPLTKGVKSAFLQAASIDLVPGSRHAWVVVGDVDLDHVEATRTRRWLLATPDPVDAVQVGVDRAHEELLELARQQDALQRSADRASDAHHFANVIYNTMRGGALLDDHRVELGAVGRSIAVRNRPAGERFVAHVGTAGGWVTIRELRHRVHGDLELLRLVNEYIPLTFSRRHGDPSRPWNRFEIPARGADGSVAEGYEGNWRDIFQNWEALLHSFPDYFESAVSKFLSASTRDGHNPYRINHEGIDWEVPEKGSWGNFGYWGDHQIVYLHKLLEALDRFHPGTLEANLGLRAYSYAAVPYRILPYASIVSDPKHTLMFDGKANREIRRREAVLGTDARLVLDEDGAVHHASLAEKLLVPALAKLSNLVPGGGIWMNMQRPEWNDANNALVGIGVSVVTAFHLHEYLRFVLGVLERTADRTVPLDPAVERWLRALHEAFVHHADLRDASAIDATGRRALLDALGGAYEAYRDEVAAQPSAAPGDVAVADVVAALQVALEHVDAVTSAAWRPDGLADSYRLLRLSDGAAEVMPLYPMLEGQVAALNAHDLEPERVTAVIDALFASDLYREDQASFLLYPDRELPSFLDRNRVATELLTPDLEALIDGDLQILRRDADDNVRFAAGLVNVGDLAAHLEAAEESTRPSPATQQALLDAYEATFGHARFTGRSQSMYRYEGLGSIYWHMVAKLLAAVQEQYLLACERGADAATLDALRAGYERIRDGLGYRKPVAVQGAFPLDPHSHTPAHAGAQQPGMTGAVKEGVLLRLGELGVIVRDGRVRFAPRLLDPDDFLDERVTWLPLGQTAMLGAGTLGFTYCGVPVVYHVGDDEPWIRVTGPDLERFEHGEELDEQISGLLLSRSGAISRIDVGVQPPNERQRS